MSQLYTSLIISFFLLNLSHLQQEKKVVLHRIYNSWWWKNVIFYTNFNTIIKQRSSIYLAATGVFISCSKVVVIYNVLLLPNKSSHKKRWSQFDCVLLALLTGFPTLCQNFLLWKLMFDTYEVLANFNVQIHISSFWNRQFIQINKSQ